MSSESTRPNQGKATNNRVVTVLGNEFDETAEWIRGMRRKSETDVDLSEARTALNAVRRMAEHRVGMEKTGQLSQIEKKLLGKKDALLLDLLEVKGEELGWHAPPKIELSPERIEEARETYERALKYEKTRGKDAAAAREGEKKRDEERAREEREMQERLQEERRKRQPPTGGATKQDWTVFKENGGWPPNYW